MKFSTSCVLFEYILDTKIWRARSVMSHYCSHSILLDTDEEVSIQGDEH